MCKLTNLSVSNQDNPEKFILPSVNNLTLEANTSSMCLSSLGGLPILQNEERHLSLSSHLCGCIRDKRKQHLVQHTLEEIIMMRIYQICLGYEDVNDCDRTRKDPMMQLAVSQGGLNKELCSSATMCRFENMVTEEELLAIQEMFVTMFILSYKKAPSHIILDCDDTNVDTYGAQQGTLFNTYYDSYCYMPLLIFEGYSGKMILPLLKPGRRNKSANIADTLQWLISRLREVWPKTVITVRGDSHFTSHDFMDWAKLNDHKVFFITGLSANSVLLKNPVVKELTEKVKRRYDLLHHPIREFGEFHYKAGSWTLPERVVVKVEITQKGELNIRFIVTNIKSVEARPLYQTTYCGRGKDELYIRQFKEAVSGDRLSCHTFKANRLRIFLYAAAYILMHSIRERALKDTSLERASLLTVRERLLLSAVCIRVLKTKICLDYAKHHPMKRELRHVLQFYEQRKVS